MIQGNSISGGGGGITFEYPSTTQPSAPEPMTRIPGSIVKAISRIQMSVEAISKSQRNNHGGYQFASTDDIYAGVTRKMGEVGLVIVPLETKHEIVKVEKEGKTVQWLHAC